MDFRGGRTPQERALRHVAAVSRGAAVDPTLRITLNSHPDRLVGGRPILEVWPGRCVCLAVRHGHEQRRAHRTPRRRPLALGEPDLRRGVQLRTPAHERPVYGAELPAPTRRRGAPLRLLALPADRCGPAAGHLLLSRQRGRAVRVGVARDVPDRDGRGGRAGRAQRLHRGAGARPRRPGEDMEALVLDASYRGTAVEATARRLPCPVEWHPGLPAPRSRNCGATRIVARSSSRRRPDRRGRPARPPDHRGRRPHRPP